MPRLSAEFICVAQGSAVQSACVSIDSATAELALLLLTCLAPGSSQNNPLRSLNKVGQAKNTQSLWHLFIFQIAVY